MGRRRGWDSNPRGLSPNALAGRRLKPLGHPSKLPLLGSNQDSPDPESGVLPVTPRGKVQRLAFQTAIYAPAANDPTLSSNPGSVQTRPAGRREPPVGIEPTTPSLRMTCSTTELRWHPNGAEGSRTPDL